MQFNDFNSVRISLLLSLIKLMLFVASKTRKLEVSNIYGKLTYEKIPTVLISGLIY